MPDSNGPTHHTEPPPHPSIMPEAYSPKLTVKTPSTFDSWPPRSREDARVSAIPDDCSRTRRDSAGRSSSDCRIRLRKRAADTYARTTADRHADRHADRPERQRQVRPRSLGAKTVVKGVRTLTSGDLRLQGLPGPRRTRTGGLYDSRPLAEQREQEPTSASHLRIGQI